MAYLQCCLVVTWLVPCETTAVCTCSVYTIQPCTSLQCHFMQSHICRVHVCLAVTCHPHFWHNDQDLLHASAIKGVEVGGGTGAES